LWDDNVEDFEPPGAKACRGTCRGSCFCAGGFSHRSCERVRLERATH